MTPLVVVLWFLAIYGILFSFVEAVSEWNRLRGRWLGARRAVQLRQVSTFLGRFKGIFISGLIPDEEKWNELRSLPAPWGTMAFQTLRSLRERGAALIPALTSLEEAARDSLRRMDEVRAQTAQARAQALTIAALVPLVAAAFSFLLPGTLEDPFLWFSVVLASLALNALAAVWLAALSQSAARGGLLPENESWVLHGVLAIELASAGMKSGEPADLAWSGGITFLEKTEAASLAQVWGRSLWVASDSTQTWNEAEKKWVEWGQGIRNLLHYSLMEGQGVSVRLQTLKSDFLLEWEMEVKKKCQELSQKALLPLFVLVFPSVLLLMACAFFLELSARG